MRNKRGLTLILTGLLLVAAALGLTGYNLWDEQRAAAAADHALAALEEQIPQTPIQQPEGTLADYQVAPMMEMPVIKVDEYGYIGYLRISSLELELPVLSEWSYPNLKLAPCRYEGSAYQDHFVICAHNYRQHFGTIKDLRPGDLVEFVDVDGNLFSYLVTELEQLNATEIEGMTTGDWDLSLFTCTVGGQYRVTVRCEKLES